jgi:hypothetical protein
MPPELHSPPHVLPAAIAAPQSVLMLGHPRTTATVPSRYDGMRAHMAGVHLRHPARVAPPPPHRMKRPLEALQEFGRAIEMDPSNGACSDAVCVCATRGCLHEHYAAVCECVRLYDTRHGALCACGRLGMHACMHVCVVLVYFCCSVVAAHAAAVVASCVVLP